MREHLILNQVRQVGRPAGATQPIQFPPSLLRYPGGKSRLRKLFTGRILNHWNDGVDREYREPFLGGDSVALAVLSDARVQRAWLNDYDPAVAALWLAVQHQPDDLVEAIRAFRPSQSEFYRIKEFFLTTPVQDLRAVDCVELGVKKLALHRISHNGNGAMSGGPQGGCNGGDEIASRWNAEKLCWLVPQLHQLLATKDVRITAMDFETVIATAGDCVIYLDPPYWQQGPALYQHAFATRDHRRLRDALRRCSQPWILSYDLAVRALYGFANVEAIAAKELLITPRTR